MICRITSFPSTHFPGRPERTIRIVSGTLSHTSPENIAAARSVLPTPVEKAHRAP